jgi:acetoin utilization protein AcuB
MLVRDRMSSPAVTVNPEIPFQDALKLMRERQFRRLPVVDNKGRLVGIVAERDLLYASPSPATSLSVWELNYLLSKITIRELMTKAVITTTPDTPIEDAAHLMREKRIGGLPVIDDNHRSVGIITETDIFKTFVEMLGGGQAGLRLSLEIPRKKGVLAQLTQAIFELGGNIISIGSFNLDAPGDDGLVLKVQDVRRDQLVDTLEAIGDHVIDAREVERHLELK